MHASQALRIQELAVAHDWRLGHDVSDPACERDPAGIEIIPTSIMCWPFGKACYYAGVDTASSDTRPACAEGTVTGPNLSRPGGVFPGQPGNGDLSGDRTVTMAPAMSAHAFPLWLA